MSGADVGDSTGLLENAVAASGVMPDSQRPAAEFRFGAVAFLDALGFKGIWSRYAPGAVIDNLRSVTFGEPIYSDRPLQLDGFSLSSHVITLSDTIVVSAALTPDDPGGRDVRSDLECKVAALASVCCKAGMLCSMVLSSSTPLVYRGAVSVGDFIHDDRFLIGPAIDEAAEHEKLADAGLVWLAPSAQQIAREAWGSAEGLFQDLELFVVPNVDVPMKDGTRELTCVVNPLRFSLDHDEFLQRAEGTFTGGSEGVQRKRANTVVFLRHARNVLVRL